MLCCAGPALLSTGLLTAGAGVVFGAGAIGTVGLVAILVGLHASAVTGSTPVRIDTHRATCSARPSSQRTRQTIRTAHREKC